MWNLPGPGLEPVFPALADRFLTTAPPEKPLYIFFSEVSVKVFGPFFNQLVCFLTVEF